MYHLVAITLRITLSCWRYPNKCFNKYKNIFKPFIILTPPVALLGLVSVTSSAKGGGLNMGSASPPRRKQLYQNALTGINKFIIL